MGVEVSMVRARFALRFRCANCRSVMCRELISPELEDAPADIEELLGSNLLAGQIYACETCENPVSTLISVKQLQEGEDAGESAAVEVLGQGRRKPMLAQTALQRSALFSPARRRGLG